VSSKRHDAYFLAEAAATQKGFDMRKTFIAALTLAAITLAFSLPIATSANAAIYYPWCAHYSGEFGGGTNCYFQTRAQCAATVSGVGGVCQANPFYDAYGSGQEPGYSARPAKRTRARHHY
jgi:hypothetical protein